jgi:hypothetical protein
MVNDDDDILYLGGDPDADRADELSNISGIEAEVCGASMRALAKTDC